MLSLDACLVVFFYLLRKNKSIMDETEKSETCFPELNNNIQSLKDKENAIQEKDKEIQEKNKLIQEKIQEKDKIVLEKD
ncbi:hypothetical protein GLOIN_2v1678675, partial [Rhizophagus irregularis DAOM 181602=DAOM 197198]